MTVAKRSNDAQAQGTELPSTSAPKRASTSENDPIVPSNGSHQAWWDLYYDKKSCPQQTVAKVINPSGAKGQDKREIKTLTINKFQPENKT
ncbi:hypothetical protein SVAN01_09955 [Stagonosporopsis vannaccii]|nr:hypothetical protein SVAN01_09955 [Stagonosporopsis vannaccii]